MGIINKQNLIGCFSESTKEFRAIIDISVYPFLIDFYKKYHNKNDISKVGENIIFYIPDTIYDLCLKSVVNKDFNLYYAKIMTTLFKKWTRREIDIKLLKDILSAKKFFNINIELITEENIESYIYDYCNENIINDELIISFSKEKNLLGDIIGKLL